MILLAVPAAVATAAGMPADSCNHRLYYTAPATMWEETLPLGNGRLGMMPDGGILQERIVLNEISLWSGSESDYGNPDAAKSLPAIRQLLFEGKNLEAQELMYSSFVPKKQETDGRYGFYQTLGDLEIQYHYPGLEETAEPIPTGMDSYIRELSLRDGVARTTFSLDGIRYAREYYVSRDRDVMVIHLTADAPRSLHFSANLHRAERAALSVLPPADGDAANGTLLMEGTLDSGKPGVEGMRYRVAMRLIAQEGACALSVEHGFELKGGREAWLLLSATTSYEAEGTAFPGARYREACDSLLTAGLPDMASHVAAHRALYDRVSLTLPVGEADALPTDQRLLSFSEEPSPAMAALYYNYGRYLFISSTRPGSLPPNLQGLWANTIYTPWNGDYHTNINIQMNYWPMEQAGLQELIQPLTALIERLVPSGEESARAFYGEEASGWVLHMMTNVWNYTAPGEHPSWGATNTGGAWLCAHLWDHYLYTQDKAYLRRVYPLMKGAAEFFHTTLVEEPTHGWLVTAPTSSPENAFYVDDDREHAVSVCMGPTMDIQILTELFTNVMEAASLLDCDAGFAEELRADLAKFPPMQISSQGGYLQEWLEDYAEEDVHHRHVSHLYGLHPGHLISPDATPALAEACRVTLNRRGDEATGWSRAWKINFWARLGDGNRAWKLFQSLLHPAIEPVGKDEAEQGEATAASAQEGDKKAWKTVSGTFPNLFCAHPPFQIDGNFGGMAGIGEMLLQSHEGFINLLPALPDNWQEGSLRGWHVRGGAVVDLDWKGGKAVKATLTALVPGTFTMKMPAGATRAELTLNGAIQETDNTRLTFELDEGTSAEIRFY